MKNPIHELQERMKGRCLVEVARRAGTSTTNVYGHANNPDVGMRVSTLMALHKAMDEIDAEKEQGK